MPTVQVTFDVRRPETHLVCVTMKFPATREATRTFRMPAWVPGSYKIRDFGRHVQDVEVKVGGRRAHVEQPTKDSWVVPDTRGEPVELRYDVYSRELTVDTSHVTADHAHLFPATLVMYDAASRPLPHKVTLTLPPGWDAWSGLETKALDGKLEVASDYDHLIDCPIECGPPSDYLERRFAVAGKTHRIVVWRAPDADWPRITRDVKAIVETAAAIWKDVPYQHYTFLGHVAFEHGGGLEHRNSTVLGIDPLHVQSREKLETRFYPLVAHEFWHTWNVKRILPAAFQPYELQQESYTDLLWLFEGFTSYYELPVLARAGVVSEESWTKTVGEDLEAYHKAVGRNRRSVAEASRFTWTLLYQPHEHNINRNVSYYTKGMWVGLCLDAELRRRGVKAGLDDVMRLLWKMHGKTGTGLSEDGFADRVEQATDANLRAKLARWIDGTQELPIAAAFRTLGWDLKQEHKDPKKKFGLGVHLNKTGTVIERIPQDAPAWRVLQPDDEIVAVEGYRWKGDRFADFAADQKAGALVNVTVFREGRLRSMPVALLELPKEKFTLKKRKGAKPKHMRERWLGTKLRADPKADAKPKSRRARRGKRRTRRGR